MNFLDERKVVELVASGKANKSISVRLQVAGWKEGAHKIPQDFSPLEQNVLQTTIQADKTLFSQQVVGRFLTGCPSAVKLAEKYLQIHA